MKYLNVSLFLVGMLLMSCGKSNKTDGEKVDVQTELSKDGPLPSNSPMLQKDTLKLNGQLFYIHIDRQIDKTSPTIKDENNTIFYDNCVKVDIRTIDNTFFEHTFTKSDFNIGISEEEYAKDVLQGMALDKDKSTGTNIILTSQVGQPGMDGEGFAFSVSIDLHGNYKITPASNQPTMRDDMLGD